MSFPLQFVQNQGTRTGISTTVKVGVGRLGRGQPLRPRPPRLSSRDRVRGKSRTSGLSTTVPRTCPQPPRGRRLPSTQGPCAIVGGRGPVSNVPSVLPVRGSCSVRGPGPEVDRVTGPATGPRQDPGPRPVTTIVGGDSLSFLLFTFSLLGWFPRTEDGPSRSLESRISCYRTVGSRV